MGVKEMKMNKFLIVLLALALVFSLALVGCNGDEEPEEPNGTDEPGGEEPGGETDEPGEVEEPEVDEDGRAFVNWETMENGAMFLAMLVPKADDAIAKGLVTELQADYILHNAIALGTWPRGSSPGYSDVIYAPATYGYDKVPENWDGPKYISAPRP